MKSIPSDFIDSLLATTDIVSIIKQKIPMQRKGDNHIALCPFHSEKTPSFSVSKSKQIYHCFGCGAGGDAIQFVMDFENMSFVEAITHLAEIQGIKVPQTKGEDWSRVYACLQQVADYYSSQLYQNPGRKPVIKYLKSRGLDSEICKEFNIGFAPNGWNNLSELNIHPDLLEQAGLIIKKSGKQYDRFRNRIMFPIIDRQSRVIGFGGRVLTENDNPKYLNSPETVVFSKRSEVYGINRAKREMRSASHLLIVEGYMDVISLAQYDINNVVASLGTAITKQQVTMLFKQSNWLIFCFDSDTAGRKAAWKALETCLPLVGGEFKVSFILLPEGEDPDSFVRKYGKDKFTEQVDNSSNLSEFLFKQLQQQHDFTQSEDKATFATRAKELIKQVTNPILQELMFDRLSSLLNLDIELFQSKPTFKPKAPRKVRLIPPKSLAIKALAIITYHANLLDLIGDWSTIANSQVLGAKLFVAVCDILKQNPEISTEGIATSLPKQLAKHFMPHELRAITLEIPVNCIEQELIGAVKRLRELAKNCALDSLLAKAKLDKLTVEEKKKLQEMLKESHKVLDPN